MLGCNLVCFVFTCRAVQYLFTADLLHMYNAVLYVSQQTTLRCVAQGHALGTHWVNMPGALQLAGQRV